MAAPLRGGGCKGLANAIKKEKKLNGTAPLRKQLFLIFAASLRDALKTKYFIVMDLLSCLLKNIINCRFCLAK